MSFGAGSIWAWEKNSGQSGDKGANRRQGRIHVPSQPRQLAPLLPELPWVDNYTTFPSKDQQSLFLDSHLITEPEEAIPRSGPLAGTASLRAALPFPALTGTLSYKQSCARDTGYQQKPKH